MKQGTNDQLPQTVAAEAHLIVNQICKHFEIDGNTIPVLDDIHFAVRRGEFVCISGRSGCGKTTLLNILAGFLTPDSGMVTLDGKPIARPGPDRCVVFQQDALFPWLTVRENVTFGLKFTGKKTLTLRSRVAHMLRMVGLTDFQNYLPREISGGMKQRVSLARVLVLEPCVLLMDEPFVSLDAQTRVEMQELLASLWVQTNCTILFVTHDIEEAVAMSDRVLLLDACPSRIRMDLSIPLERPRDRAAPQFTALKRKLQEALRQD